MNNFKGVKLLTVLLLLFLFTNASHEGVTFSLTPACMDAAQQISQLKLRSASDLLEKEKSTHPYNAAIDYLENFVDFYSLITSQDIAELKLLEKNKARRLEKLNHLPLNNPYKMYAQAEVNLQWAFSRVFQGEFMNAAFEFRAAYRLLDENSKRFPSFSHNQKDLGMLLALFGTIPENFQWILKIVGVKGNLKEGLKKLRNYVDQPLPGREFILEKQTGEYYYTFLQLNFGDKEECWKFCDRVTADYRQNLLSAYLRIFTAIKTAHNDDAIACILSKPAGNEFTSFPILDYYCGVAFLNQLNPNAPLFLKKFVTFSKGQNLIKEAYKRLSWYYLISGESERARVYRKMIKKYGATVSNEDKLALREAESDVIPDVTLLKARLLCDGGYFYKAEESLLGTTATSFSNPDFKAEYFYRLGRINQEQKKFQKAIDYYTQVFTISPGNPYFSTASSLQLGVIYEKFGNRDQAKKYYDMALKNNFQFGMNQQAKAGLARISKD